ncbi:SusD/RagB family nutrient-binding outer membrane lipoprotein [Hymenobacter sp. HMF4947]|uniref:SusD/RagB family nutrient-binding outer membrane lipoprotein n=1 Tax=Hymenobacter ginkgonis TaxID=2682976 RepID=A0A7K1TAC2_9BACT|nr:SusD/RagB family nutrient-binding outer membrane lipoprotein [Hymenobacter ginkgonis]MVN75366.1 SusD/RagB family nutrient-binding outer membrane lipoprotein [Hymenobacter ginkgonis]
MKSLFTKTTVLASAALLLASSCTDRFKEINTNPTTYSQASFDANYLLTQSQLTYTGSTDFAYETWRGNLIYCATFMQGMSSVISYWAGDKYLLNEGYTAAYWERAYSEQVKSVTDLVASTDGKPQYKNLHQIARIMRALIMERITDLYGDAPYSQAGQGYYQGIITPVYDKQQDIYNDLIKEVTEASAALDPGADIASGDVFYKGNIAQWQRFSNTLLLRLGMRLLKVDPAKAQAIATQVQGKTMTSDADNAYVLFDVAGGRATQNRNSQVLLGDGGQEHYYVKWSQTFINYLKTNNDPRLSKIAVTQLYLSDGSKTQNANFVTTAAAQKGMPNGRDLSGRAAYDISTAPGYTTFPDYSSPNPGMIKRTGPAFILTYAESELLLADAAQRFNLGSAAQHYTAGVTSAMSYLSQYDATMTVAPADITAYLAAHPYTAAQGLEQINTQYWALTCSMLDFYEAWSNWRRTGYPTLTPVVYPNNATNGQIPRRFPYPTGEITSNPTNYKAASTAVTGGDNLLGRVYWDK